MIGPDDIKDGGVRKIYIYKNKKENLVLALLSKSYSKLDTILVDTSSTLLDYLILSTNYLSY